jgi:hypothetical protein
VTAGSCDLKRLGDFALRVNVNHLARLYAERWAVNALTVNQNVAVNNHLACLCDGASNAGTQHKGV